MKKAAENRKTKIHIRRPLGRPLKGNILAIKEMSIDKQPYK